MNEVVINCLTEPSDKILEGFNISKNGKRLSGFLDDDTLTRLFQKLRSNHIHYTGTVEHIDEEDM